MSFDGPPPAFVIMVYGLALAAAIMGLRIAMARSGIDKVVLFEWPFRMDLGLLAFFFLLGAYFANLLAVINVMIDSNKHAIDGIILTIFLLVNVLPLIVLIYEGRR